MRFFSRSSRRAIAILCTLGVTLFIESTIAVRAQEEPVIESFTSYVGELLEIETSNVLRSPQFSWVLSKNRMFMGATRGPIFRARLTEPGVYRLDASIREAETGNEVNRTLSLTVQSRALIPGTVSQPDAETGAVLSPLLTTVPAASQGVLLLSEDRHIVKFSPIRSDVAMMDLIGQIPRSNSDKVSLSTDTAFRTDGLPIYIWFVSPVDNTHLQAIGTLSDGTQLEQEFTIRTSVEPPQQVDAPSQTIAVNSAPDGSLRFTLNAALPSTPLLFSWDFGDGSQSLLSSPSHTYMRSGTYSVAVTVIDLNTGTPLGTSTQSVTVQASVRPTGSASSSVSMSTAVRAKSSTSDTAILNAMSVWPTIQKVLWVIVVLLVIVLIVAFIVWMVRKLSKLSGSLADHLEKAETKLTQPGEDSAAVIDVAPPMEIKRTTPEIQPEVVEEAAMRSDATTVVEPKEPTEHIDIAVAPAWLRKGLEMQNQETKSPSEISPISEHSTTILEQETPSNTNSDEALPSWLTESRKEAETPNTPAQMQPMQTSSEPISPIIDSNTVLAANQFDPVEQIETFSQATLPPQSEPTIAAAFTESATPTIEPLPAEDAAPATPLSQRQSPPAANDPLQQKPDVTSEQLLPPLPASSDSGDSALSPLAVTPPASSIPSAQPPSDAALSSEDFPSKDAKLISTSMEEERERERKRAKRKRYRENLKIRKLAAKEQASKTPDVPQTPEFQPSAQEVPSPATSKLPQQFTQSTASSAPEKKDDDVVFLVEAQGVVPQKKTEPANPPPLTAR